MSFAIASSFRRAFDWVDDPADGLLQFIRDLAIPPVFGVREDVLDRSHVSYSEMTDTLVLAAESGGEPLDLVVLAYSISELDPRRCVATRAHRLSAGDPFGFAISDQGTAAPFTALALIESYLRSGACHRALLVVAEQADVPYHVPTGTALPERDTAVALVLDRAAGARVRALRLHASVAPSEVEARVAADLAALPSGPSGPSGLSGSSGPVTVIGPGGLPSGLVCTAPWWALAEELDRPDDDPRRTVLVNYEASLGYLGVLVVDRE